VRRVVFLSVAAVFWMRMLGLSSAPAWAVTRMTVSPSTDLQGQQVVQVTGEEWPANAVVGIFTVYLDSDGNLEALGPVTDAHTDGGGSFSQSVKVKRVIDQEHDCAKLGPGDKCALFAADKPHAINRAQVDITFAPK